MKHLLVLLLFAFSSYHLAAASKVAIVMQLLEKDLISEATLDIDEFGPWSKGVTDELTAYLEQVEGDHDIMLQFTLHRDADASVSVAMKPELNDTVAAGIQALLSKHITFRSKLVDYSFIIYASVNNGKIIKGDYKPQILSPRKQRMADFKKLDLAGKKEALQSWTRTQIIPIIAHYESKVDKVFKGVLAIGEIMETESFMTKEIEELTHENPDYWRGVLEMEQGNLLIPFSKICMHLAKGEFDEADGLLFFVGIFSMKGSLATIYEEEISEKLSLFTKELNAAIEDGIKLHDARKYDEAIAVYEGILLQYPNSAWATYELYFSKASKKNDLTALQEDWKIAKADVYRCNPMYPTDVHASNGPEAYRLFRRQEINTLFKSNEAFAADILNYGDIALDLGNYGIAAQVYWQIQSQLSKKVYGSRNMLAYFLYCLDQLGDTKTITNFEGNFPAEFEKIEKARRKAMEKHPMYQAMAGK